jgi:AmiR/NasT family two-component response regulator
MAELIVREHITTAQAKGILMELFTIDPVTAFSLLAQLSENRRQPMWAVAR